MPHPVRPTRPAHARLRVFLLVLITIGLLVAAVTGGLPVLRSDLVQSSAPTSSHPVWPAHGQAAVRLPGAGYLSSPGRHEPVPIASLTKIMTALVVLERLPITPQQDGITVTVSAADARDTARSREAGESVVPVRAGERITEREALLAVMLPSANNMARLLARRVAGSQARFVDLMNERARTLHLDDTSYADASGLDARSVSTAHDQVKLAETALQNLTFSWLVRQSSADIPVAGTVRTTDRLLGRHGFVGVKTGSHTAAGGCFVFAVQRRIEGRTRLVVGAVLGQRGQDLLGAAFESTTALVESL